MATQIPRVPSSIAIPSTAPTDAAGTAGYLTTLGVQLNSWIATTANAVNSLLNGSSAVQVGDWSFSQNSTGDLVLTRTNTSSGVTITTTIVFPNLTSQGTSQPVTANS